MVYRTAILFLHGRMGKRRRAVVPACIGRLPIDLIPLKTIHILHCFFSLVAKIRELYPEADGNYMGFKKKEVKEKKS